MRSVSAINRFGWGQRDGSSSGLSVQDWLAGQLTGPDRAVFAGVGPCADGLVALREQRKAKMQGDPLGVIALALGEAPALGFATLDRERVAHARRVLPVLENRRFADPVLADR